MATPYPIAIMDLQRPRVGEWFFGNLDKQSVASRRLHGRYRCTPMEVVLKQGVANRQVSYQGTLRKTCPLGRNLAPWQKRDCFYWRNLAPSGDLQDSKQVNVHGRYAQADIRHNLAERPKSLGREHVDPGYDPAWDR